MNFTLSISKFTENTAVDIKDAILKISLDILSNVVLATPVDTGQARANWQVASGSAPSGVIDAQDKSGSSAIAKFTIDKIDQNIYIVNNLPYIQRLEEGYSKQAPRGMVALTLQKYEAK